MSDAGSHAPRQAATREPPTPQPDNWRPDRELTKVDHVLSPTHQVAFPGAQHIYEVKFSPDGRTAYCLVDGRSVDLWLAGVHRWPEVLGGVLGLLVVAYLFVFAWVRRRPQVPGEAHCRRCNYHVVTQAPDAARRGADRRLPPPGTLCPECGVDLFRRRPRRGRSTRRRMLAPTVALGVCVVGYAALHVSGASRAGAVARSLGLWSDRVDALAERHQVAWLLKFSVAVSRIVRVDTESGRIMDRLRTMRGIPAGGMEVSPDGRFLAVGDSLSVLRWISTSSGRVVASTNGGEFRSGHNTSFIAGFDGSADDPWVYYSAADQKSATSRLFRWRPRTGEQHVVIEEPAYITTYSNGARGAMARRYALLRRADGLAVVSASDFMQAYDQKRYVVSIRAPEASGGQEERQISLEDEFLCSSPLVVTPDGRTIFLTTGHAGVIGLDTTTGARLGTLRPAMFDTTLDKLAISADGRRLFMAVHPNAVLVRDIVEKRWSARCVFPQPFIAPEVSPSPNGRWLALTPFRSGGGSAPAGPYVHELFLFDLRPLSGDPTSPGASEPGTRKGEAIQR